jgi:hypothetical protein
MLQATADGSEGRTGVAVPARPERSLRTIWTDEQIVAALQLLYERRDKRLYPYLVEHVVNCYGAYRKRAIAGDGSTSKPQLCHDLYAKGRESKNDSARRHTRLLEEIGAIRTQVHTSAAGKTLGLLVECFPVPEEVAVLSCARSSAGSSDGIRLRRRRLSAEERCEARVRPRCPRSDRGAPHRFKRPLPLFYPARVRAPGGEEGFAPVGGSPSSPVEAQAARARGGPGASSVDAIERSEEEGDAAALERRLKAALGGEALSALARAEEAFAAVLGPPPKGRLRHLPTIRSLLWALARLDRYADFGRGSPGAGLAVLEGKIEVQAHLIRFEGAAAPAHLGYFLPALRAEARRWKHTWAPQIKARRRRRAGVGAPAGTPPGATRPAPQRQPPANRGPVGAGGVERRLEEFRQRAASCAAASSLRPPEAPGARDNAAL